MEEIGCKCQTFLSLLSGRRKQTRDIFFPSLYKFKRRFLLKYCVAINDTWFHLKLTILKPWVNQCIFLMEMFVLSYVNILCIYHQEPTWQTSMLYSEVVPLICVKETICTVICPSTRFKSIVLWPGMNHLVPRLSQNASYIWGAWCHSELLLDFFFSILSFKTFLFFINRLLVTM